MLGMVNLPEHNMPKLDGMSNLKGWWKPPSYVLSFWANACYIEFNSSSDYENKKKHVLKSYDRSIKQFWKENVL
jgi:hypothetical protein